MNHPTQPPGQARYLNGNLVSVIATDYGGTISLDRLDHLIGQKPVDPAAAAALRVLHDDLGLGLVLASNTQPHETRWPALQQAGIDGLFTAAVLSYPFGVRKPSPVFYQVVLAVADCSAGQVLFVGDHLENDAAAPVRHGMQAALVRPRGLRPGEVLPDGALLITHVRELPSLLQAHSDRPADRDHQRPPRKRGTKKGPA